MPPLRTIETNGTPTPTVAQEYGNGLKSAAAQAYVSGALQPTAQPYACNAPQSAAQAYVSGASQSAARPYACTSLLPPAAYRCNGSAPLPPSAQAYVSGAPISLAAH